MKQFFECQQCDWRSHISETMFSIENEYEQHFLDVHFVFPVVWQSGIDFDEATGEDL